MPYTRRPHRSGALLSSLAARARSVDARACERRLTSASVAFSFALPLARSRGLLRRRRPRPPRARRPDSSVWPDRHCKRAFGPTCIRNRPPSFRKLQFPTNTKLSQSCSQKLRQNRNFNFGFVGFVLNVREGAVVSVGLHSAARSLLPDQSRLVNVISLLMNGPPKFKVAFAGSSLCYLYGT